MSPAMKLVFVLPGRGGGGGAHSVVQESVGLRKLGVEVSIAASDETYAHFRANYPELEQNRIAVPPFTEASELAQVLARADLVVATTAPSAHTVAEAVMMLQDLGETAPRTAYYIQDYEPLFFTPGSPEWTAARNSYSALPNALLIAKTQWLCSVVRRNHEREVVKVSPSLDHAVFHPEARPADQTAPIAISAMIRPKTPRRAPRRTARILERIAAEFGERVTVSMFGCDAGELEATGLKLSPAIARRGVLARRDVADVHKATNLFLDLSDYQAFGRSGLEAMACGCVPLLPLVGGAGEYGRHRKNAFLVDTRSDEAIMEAVRDYVTAGIETRAAMRYAAVTTALNFSIERAAYSEYEAFASFLA